MRKRYLKCNIRPACFRSERCWHIKVGGDEIVGLCNEQYVRNAKFEPSTNPKPTVRRFPDGFVEVYVVQDKPSSAVVRLPCIPEAGCGQVVEVSKRDLYLGPEQTT